MNPNRPATNNAGKPEMRKLNVEQFKEALNADAVVIDLRSSSIFTQGFIPGAVFLGTNGKYLSLANSMFQNEQPLLFVLEQGSQDNISNIILSSGFKNIIGFLDGGFEAWKHAGEPIDMIIDVEADELIMDIPFDKNLMVLDVRKEMEFAEGHLEDACNIPLDELTDPAKVAQLDEGANIYLHCAGGNRSIIAASILKRHGLNNIRNVTGGWNKIKELEKAKIVKEGKLLN